MGERDELLERCQAVIDRFGLRVDAETMAAAADVVQAGNPGQDADIEDDMEARSITALAKLLKREGKV